MTTPAIVMWTNEVFHPRANVYREGYRHCMAFVWSADGWYGREFRPGAGETIYPRVAEADDDLLTMLGGNSPRLDQDLSRRRANVLPATIQPLHQFRWCWYRKRCVFHVMHHLGIKSRSIRRPFHLFEYLSPAEETPKKTSKVALVASPFVPVK